MYKYIILGAGPSGLAFAHTLKDAGEQSFILIEKETVAGGLCRSQDVDESPMDIGGGHFLDNKKREVLELLFRFLPEPEWQLFQRRSTIRIRGQEIEYPIEANLWQLPLNDCAEFLESIASAGCVRGESAPAAFESWIRWKLGEKIATEYMIPYNKKVWGIELSQLGTYWLHKLPNISFKETLISCLEREAQGRLPAHRTYLYPKSYGYGEVWKRMGHALKDQILMNQRVTRVDVEKMSVNGMQASHAIVNTIPWTIWPRVADLPLSITTAISSLRYSPIDVDYFPDSLPTKAHWIYEPDPNLNHHRILCRNNFISNSRGYWTETHSSRSNTYPGVRFHNKYAYPIGTVSKPQLMSKILNWAKQRSIIGLGRWGTWEHMNSDVAVSQAISCARDLLHQQTRDKLVNGGA